MLLLLGEIKDGVRGDEVFWGSQVVKVRIVVVTCSRKKLFTTTNYYNSWQAVNLICILFCSGQRMLEEFQQRLTEEEKR